ncbi:hypothetical protein BBJ28_00009164 [Nothophytophthora sp. Chile5]|nr:hypothetical protein BBJ28_00009164 [Nothophytophthora sp. Chile5]
MGKTPSPDSFLRASAGLRYRRKVPLASDNQQETVAPLAPTQPKAAPPKKKLKPQRPVDAQPKHAAVREPERLGGQRTAANGRRPASGGGKSLLKQLLWKAKPVQPQRAEAAAEEAAAAEEEERPTPEEDEEEEEEEAAFAAAQRQARKLQASQTAAAKEAPFGEESSSQETQSGSEDETFLPFSSLTPSGDAEPLRCFPTPFPLELLAGEQQQLRVHEVLVADFAFQPAELRIQRGDVVVWRVSPATLGMVEHCLEASFTAASGVSGIAGESAGSPPLGAGSRFAWRFATAGRAAVACSVYNAQSVIIVVDEEADAVEEAEAGHVGTPETGEPQSVQQQKAEQERADARRKQKQQRQKQKQKLKNKQKRAAARQQQQLLLRPEGEADDQLASPAEDARPEDEMAPMVVFHPPCSLASEMDAEVCRAVLSQLEEVAPCIVVGDVACPMMGDSDAEDPTVTREEEAAVEQTGASAEEAVAGFQQHVIAMLQRSEEVQKQRRESFVVDRSGFDAAASYDFFKRRTSGWSCCVPNGLGRWITD